MAFYFSSASCKIYGPLAPSSYEVRYKPFSGSMNQKTQKMRKQRGRSVENGKYEWEWYNDPSRKPLDNNPFPRVTNLLGYHDNHQGEIRKKI
jgi:hypothetical protein